MTQKNKKIYALITTVLIGATVFSLYPIGNKLLHMVRDHSYVYGYSLPKNFEVRDISQLPPAQAVPILMYHGVRVNGQLGANTERETFIVQMEMLKKEGYETISIKDYDLFRQGNFTLPAKPIIITFDDGRNDSFYTVDDILKKLGFKATIFIPTIKADQKDPFYLGWDDLKNLQATGRWEIEAHGQRSHEDVIADQNNTIGMYLTSRIYSKEKGLESIEDYKKRVEADYANGISDLKNNLGIYPEYFAVPLNDYGFISASSYEGSYTFNMDLTRNFFKLAFIQARNDNGNVMESFYNYKDSDPYKLRRLEVKDMSSEDLLSNLEHFSPKPPALVFPDPSGTQSFLRYVQALYGSLDTAEGIILTSNASSSSGRILFGDQGWKNYSVKTTIIREKGHSASIIIYYNDEDNLISLDWGENSLSFKERTDGKDKELASYYPFEKGGEVEILLSVHDGLASAYFSGVKIASGVPVKLTHGAAGFGVWDQNSAQSTMTKLEIKSLDEKAVAALSSHTETDLVE